MMPLQVVYVHEKRKANKTMASFGFGSGTLQGHLLVSAFSLAHHIWWLGNLGGLDTFPFPYLYKIGIRA
jgi:hypothetical protein